MAAAALATGDSSGPDPTCDTARALMVDELEYVSLPLSAVSGGDRRLEAETYLTGGFGIRTQIESALHHRRLGDAAEVTQPSRLKGIQVAEGDGTPFFTATQVYDIRPTPRKWLAPSKTPNLETRFVSPGTILLTCSGNVGDPMMAFAPHVGVIVSHDLLRIKPHSADEAGYLYTFLRSRYGRTMLRSSQYGSVVKHLEPEHLLDVPLPLVPEHLIISLDRRIAEVFRLREEAYLDTIRAEEIYAEQFPAVATVDDETGFTIRLARTFGGQRRLDAHYYNPAARRILAALEASGNRVEPLSRVTKKVFGVGRFKHVYKPDGIPYLDSEDLYKLNPKIDKFIPEVTKKDAERYFVDKGWLLMACSGQLYGFNGSVVIADAWHERKIISNHVLRIVPDDIRSGYLAMALGHPRLGRPLVLRTAFGSEIPEIPPESLLEIPVPRLGPVEDEIADLVEGATAKRFEAKQIEDDAVWGLENYLEKLLHGDAEAAGSRDADWAKRRSAATAS